MASRWHRRGARIRPANPSIVGGVPAGSRPRTYWHTRHSVGLYPDAIREERAEAWGGGLNLMRCSAFFSTCAVVVKYPSASKGVVEEIVKEAVSDSILGRSSARSRRQREVWSMGSFGE